ncbi:MAG: hypothetical protein ACRCU3_08515 [Eubacteriaceae bacterium]
MNKQKIIILVIALSILLIIGGFLFFNFKYLVSPGGVGALVIDPNSKDWGILDTSGNNPPSSEGIAIPGYKEIGLLANEIAQKVSLGNPEQNTCNFVISMVLKDGTELYRSGLIAPGKGLYEIELTKPLPPGVYEAFLNYDCYTPDEKPLNGASTDLTLIIQ